MKVLSPAAPPITLAESQVRRRAHEDARHSLRLEGLNGLATPEDKALAEAWVGGETTLEAAIADTLQSIRAGADAAPLK